MGFISQVSLLSWKNCIHFRRNRLMFALQILIPIFILLMIYFVITNYESKTTKEIKKYDAMSHDVHDARSSVIGIIPKTKAIEELVSFMNASYQYVPSIFGADTRPEFMLFDNDDEMELDTTMLWNPGTSIKILNVKVDDKGTLPKHLEFAIRPHASDWWTQSSYPPDMGAEPRDDDDIQYAEIIYFQKLVTEGFIKYWLSKTGGDPSLVDFRLSTQRMAVPNTTPNTVAETAIYFLPMIVVWSVLISVVVNTKNLVEEKEKKHKESMKLMGMLPSAHTTSWFVAFALCQLPIFLCITIFVKKDMGDNPPILAQSSSSLVFVFFITYAFSTMTYCFMFSNFISKGNYAALVSGAVFYSTYMPVNQMMSNYLQLSKVAKLALGLMTNCAMVFGIKIITLHEATGEGAQWSNLATTNRGDNLTLLECILMLFLDSFIHLVVYWYLDNIRAGEFGIGKPLCFCFKKSYWTGKSTEEVVVVPLPTSQVEQDPDKFEPEPTDLEIGVQTRELTKVYGHNTAVDRMTMNMYKGQITVLLGHNGAGKTTTMSMLTGFTPPTSGTATLNGHDITKDMEQIRKSLGLCPQHNVLFDTLTVWEHLYFFASLKGCNTKNIEDDIGPLLSGVGLTEKKNQQSRKLSGGQKRKLCVVISLIGQSKVVILDEPTAGMDPGARRSMWDFLQNSKEGRTILLTTHYMDEADVLGDRIAIMAQGVVKCCGSSMFLKKLYAAGYSLIIVRLPTCVLSKLTDVVISHVDTATLKSVVNQEVTFILPENETSKFPNLFKALEEQKNDLGITSFGTTATTMEQVFIKVGESALEHGDDFNENMADNVIDIDQPGVVNYKPGHWQDKGLDVGYLNTTENATTTRNTVEKPGNKSMDPELQTAESRSRMQKVEENLQVLNSNMAEYMNFTKGYDKNQGCTLTQARLRAVIVKKVLYSVRRPMFTVIQALIPVLCMLFYLLMQEIEFPSFVDVPLTLDLADYEDSIVPTTPGMKPMDDDKRVVTLYRNQFDKRHEMKSVQLSKDKTYDDYTLKLVKRMGFLKFNRRVFVGLEMHRDETKEGFHAISHYNGQPLHLHVIGVNYLMGAMLQFYLDDSYSLQSVLDPMSEDVDALSRFADLLLTKIQGMYVTTILTLGVAVLCASYAHYYIMERQVGSKHLQEVSGVNPLSYWMPSFLWDLLSYFIICLLILIMFVAFNKKEFVGGHRHWAVLLSFFMHGVAVLPYLYILQIVFKNPANGVAALTILGFSTTLVCGFLSIIVEILYIGQSDATAFKMLTIFSMMFPNFGLVRCLNDIYENYHNTKMCSENVTCQEVLFHPCCKDRCEPLCVTYQTNYLSQDRPGVGEYMVVFLISAIIEFVILVLLEKKILKRMCSGDGIVRNAIMNETLFMDEDVATEMKRVNTTPLDQLFKTDSLVMMNMHKKYRQMIAVDNACVGIPKEECFGLLGQNGAGKTSVFKMLTGDESLSGGDAYLAGHSVITHLSKVRDNMGYCPQFDALLDFMTTRETLTMYGRLRGVPKTKLKQIVINLMDVLTLTPHADKFVSALSGGNKRKLSTAVSLIGMPEFILLDEPSAGVDPEARRVLWNVLSQVRALGHTLILTSHSMEECDALCTSLAIMVNGRFVCLGSPQHLKNKFGKGYTLIVKTKVSEEGSTKPLIDYVNQHLPGTKVFDDHQGYVHFQVPDSSINLGEVFSLMEAIKKDFDIQDYAVHQTTLEQIFLAFTCSQFMTRDIPPRKICCCFYW